MDYILRKRTLRASACFVLGTVALVALATPSQARPRHAAAPAVEGVINSDSSLYSGGTAAQGQASQLSNAAPSAGASVRGSNRAARAAAAQANAGPSIGAGFGGFGGGSVVSQARQYIGTNPTGRGSLWCGAFMDMVLKQTGHAGGGNLAAGYARYGTRVSGPQVGAIVVLGRGRGSGPSGHVGIVSGIDAEGNPIVISGNHNRVVAESTYPKSRVVAYVLPQSGS